MARLGQLIGIAYPFGRAVCVRVESRYVVRSP